ncbi:MAG: metallophosphoesterase [Anaerolineae bacterium]
MREPMLDQSGSRRLSRALGALLAGIPFLAAPPNPDGIDFRSVTLMLPRLHPAFSGLRLVHISDLHINGWLKPADLAEIAVRINALAPDVIAITGDFSSNGHIADPDGLRAALQVLQPREITVAVLGNHDHVARGGPSRLRAILQDSGVLELPNRVHTLVRGEARLHLAGVDDLSFRQARLDRVLAELPPDGAAILLAHEPDFADVSAATGRFDLQLSGHTHGGQVQLPLVGPLLLPRNGRRYVDGLYRAGGMYVYTNRGLGAGHIPIRVNCRPEVTVFTLLARPEDA